MPTEFESYAHRDLTRKQIKKHAAQYTDVDMFTLIGGDEDNFPFLIRSSPDDEFGVMFWNKTVGFMEYTDEDSVRAYAAVQYLLDHAFPRFDSFADAEQYSKDHAWPRKP